jgi:vacuolar-type H+-ATPase subunit F/Vma7
MEDIAIIADMDTILGFKLVGVKTGIKFNENTLRDDLMKLSNAKILIVTEDVATIIKSKNYKVMPIMIEIPNKKGSTGHALSEISKLFEAAIGVALKEEN